MNRHIAKRGWIGFAAILSIVCGLWILLLGTRTLMRGQVHLQGINDTLRYFVGLAVDLGLIWLGIRGLRLAGGIDSLETPRTKHWRIFVGVLLIYSVCENIFVPQTRRFQPDDSAELVGMVIAWILMSWLSLWLIRSAFPRPPIPTTASQPQDTV